MSFFSGTLCEINTDDCERNMCQNGASCIDLVNGYECICAPGFQGPNCAVGTNKCFQVYAMNLIKHLILQSLLIG